VFILFFSRFCTAHSKPHKATKNMTQTSQQLEEQRNFQHLRAVLQMPGYNYAMGSTWAQTTQRSPTN
jgi:radical SAM superfamily enzyme